MKTEPFTASTEDRRSFTTPSLPLAVSGRGGAPSSTVAGRPPHDARRSSTRTTPARCRMTSPPEGLDAVPAPRPSACGGTSDLLTDPRGEPAPLLLFAWWSERLLL